MTPRCRYDFHVMTHQLSHEALHSAPAEHDSRNALVVRSSSRRRRRQDQVPARQRTTSSHHLDGARVENVRRYAIDILRSTLQDGRRWKTHLLSPLLAESHGSPREADALFWKTLMAEHGSIA